MIEMIIVVAIIAIVAGTVFVGIGFVTGKPAEKCANKLLSLMQRCRITTMGKLEARLEIYVEDDCLYVKEVVKTDGETTAKETTTQIGEAGLRVSVRISGETKILMSPEDGDSIWSVTEADPLIISYDRSSGAFKDLSAMGSGWEGKYCEEIVIKKANKTVTLTLVTRTGKITKKIE